MSSINIQDDDHGYTPLHQAVIKNNCEFVEILRNEFKAGMSFQMLNLQLIHYNGQKSHFCIS